ncbi:MAG: hypothetical protein Q8P62_00490 [Candidatus Peregrinibacteria bacterium]|nr:hypothetical protein [Candidatus Peregrinibacteria bacterium]
MYYSPYRAQRKAPSRKGYIMPFLVILCIGIIGVLVFNLWGFIFGGRSVNGVYLHILQGSVQMKTWNTQDFFGVSSDALVLQGDEFKTSADSKIIAEFFDGTVMRIAGGSDIVLSVIDDDENSPAISLLIVNGKVWVNKVYGQTAGGTIVEIRGDSVIAKSDKQSIFDFENETDENLRVVAGDAVSVDILSETGDKVVDSEIVGVGQEVVFTDEIMSSYWGFRSPSVLSALSDAFKTGEFYLWNIGEDKNPTKFIKSTSGDGQFVRVEPEVIAPLELTVDTDGDGVPDAPVEVTDEPLNPDGTKVEGTPNPADAAKTSADKTKEVVVPKISGVAPTVVSVGGGKPDDKGVYQVTANPAVIAGNPNGAVAIVVNGLQLKKFRAGDKTWSYFANIDYGYMKEGDNVYEIYGLDKDGNKTPMTTIKVFYKKPVPVVAPAPVEPKPAEEKPVQ